MFSGIVSAIGVIQDVVQVGNNRRFIISSRISGGLHIDQSIAHDGVCLTVVKVSENQHEVDVVLETLSKTTLGSIGKGDAINLEKSITPQSLLDGHLVQGHVDTTLVCRHIENNDGSWNMRFHLPGEFAQLVIPQGSICLNGVSLTIAKLFEDSFEVAIIPYTFENTNFKSLRAGQSVNAEFDVIGKYVLRQASLRIQHP